MVGDEVRVRKRFIISAINSILQGKRNYVFPIYQAIAYEDVELKGGSTKPVVFTVDTNGKLAQYVVKIFSERQLTQYDAIAKECLTYTIAEEFELQQPEAAIIRFDDGLLASIPQGIAQRIRESRQKYHFGTRLHDGYTIFHPNFRLNDLEAYEIETLFAFDIFVYNIDRNHNKPNLLVKGNKYLLIDHELSLGMAGSYLNQAQRGDFSYIYGNPVLRKHIFLPYLKEQVKKEPIQFGTFDSLLGILDISKLDRVDELLQAINCSDKNFEIIKSYIYALKEQRAGFIKSLKNFF